MSRAACSVDLVCCTLRGRRLYVLTAERGDALPWTELPAGGEPPQATARLARSVVGAVPGWMSQLPAYGGETRHPSDAPLSIAFVAAVPYAEPRAGWTWSPLDDARIPGRQGRMVKDAIACLRERIHVEPVAFRLLADRFTLSELQAAYEVVLGRRFHKASFRRALSAAGVTVALEEWRSESRGRPAQLHQRVEAPARRRGAKARAIRFDLMD